MPEDEKRNGGMRVENPGNPVRLQEIKIDGLSVSAARAGEMVKVQVNGACSTLDPVFHRLARSFCGVVENSARLSGIGVRLARAHTVLLVIHPDKTADLWVDTAAIEWKMMVKKAVEAGQAVFESNIADIAAMRFPAVEIKPDDQVACLFREGWHFGFVFDFNPGKHLDLEEFEAALGATVRRLRYWDIYDTVLDPERLSKIIGAGWFPFVEIIGHEFTKIAETLEAGFELDEIETQLIASFADQRLDHLFDRWIGKPHFESRRLILQSAIRSFRAGDPVATIKTALTEIEGILSEAYRARTGERAKLKGLLAFARREAEQKTGAPNSLFLPAAFSEYLDQYVFADFDPTGPPASAGSRHAVGHGAAVPETYTMTRALQVLLTLDQLAFYT